MTYEDSEICPRCNSKDVRFIKAFENHTGNEHFLMKKYYCNSCREAYLASYELKYIGKSYWLSQRRKK
jgi:hypothetical protein